MAIQVELTNSLEESLSDLVRNFSRLFQREERIALGKMYQKASLGAVKPAYMFVNKLESELVLYALVKEFGPQEQIIKALNRYTPNLITERSTISQWKKRGIPPDAREPALRALEEHGVASSFLKVDPRTVNLVDLMMGCACFAAQIPRIGKFSLTTSPRPDQFDDFSKCVQLMIEAKFQSLFTYKFDEEFRLEVVPKDPFNTQEASALLQKGGFKHHCLTQIAETSELCGQLIVFLTSKSIASKKNR